MGDNEKGLLLLRKKALNKGKAISSFAKGKCMYPILIDGMKITEIRTDIDKSVINMQNEDGDTAAIIAVKNDKSNFVKILKDHGADLTIMNKGGNKIESITADESVNMSDDNMLNTEQMKNMLNEELI